MTADRTTPPLDRAVTAAQRRLVFQESLDAMGWAMVIGLTAGGALVLTERLLGLAPPVAWLGPAAVAVTVACVRMLRWWRKTSRLATAEMIDQRLGLKDRMASAMFARSIPDDPFAQCVIDDANRTAATLPVAAAFPMRLARVWRCVPPAALTVALMAAYMPYMDLAGLSAARAQAKVQGEQLARVKDHLHEAVTAIELAGDRDASQPAGREPALTPPAGVADALSGISQRDMSNPALRNNAAAALSQAANKLAHEVQPHEQLFELLQNATSRLDTLTRGPADGFTEAIGRADFPAAQQAIDDLAGSIESMSDQERHALGQQFDELAQQLEQVSQQHTHGEDQVPRTISDGHRDHQPNSRDDRKPGLETDSQALQPPAQRSTDVPNTTQGDPRIRDTQPPGDGHRQWTQHCKDLSRALEQTSRAIGDRSSDRPDHQPTPREALEQLEHQLSPLARLARKIQRMHQAQQQTQRAIEGLYEPRDAGSTRPGSSDGGEPALRDSPTGPYRIRPQGDPDQGQPRVVASWLSGQPNTAAPATVPFHTAAAQARQDAERAVSDDRVPPRYHQAVRAYFNQLAGTAEVVTGPPPPPQ